MQKNMSKVVETILISNPEASLEQENLTYQSAEIQDIINNFNMADHFRDIHRMVIDLLQATANFRYATVPNGVFSELRNKKKTEQELISIFTKMESMIDSTEIKLRNGKMVSQEKKILQLALSYAYHCIVERIKSLRATDRLLPLWEQSTLKKQIESNHPKA